MIQIHFKSKLFLSLLLCLSLMACKHIKEKVKGEIDTLRYKSKQAIKEQVDSAIAKVFPPFNSKTPDTKANQQRFHDFLKVPLTSDIHNIYCFDSPIGIDTYYLFAFSCNETTAAHIIEVQGLHRDHHQTEAPFDLRNDLFWWPNEKIKNLPRYSRKNGERRALYFWYDQKDQKAYFLDVDL